MVALLAAPDAYLEEVLAATRGPNPSPNPGPNLNPNPIPNPNPNPNPNQARLPRALTTAPSSAGLEACLQAFAPRIEPWP